MRLYRRADDQIDKTLPRADQPNSGLQESTVTCLMLKRIVLSLPHTRLQILMTCVTTRGGIVRKAVVPAN